jgi:protein gp37
MNKTGIEWTELTWNPLRGCSRVSEGCRNCYAERIAARFNGSKIVNGDRAVLPFSGIAVRTPSGSQWTGRLELIESKLTEPLHKRKHATIFVNSMSDTFHEKVPFDTILRMYRVMQKAHWHKYLILTKRSKRLLEFTHWMAGADDISTAEWPRQCALGVSCEDQQRADERIPDLLATPSAMRFVSLEPLLGPVNLGLLGTVPKDTSQQYRPVSDMLHWVIVGGESGPGARPMHPDWVRSIRDQCVSAGVPFFFKQWGEWIPGSHDVHDWFYPHCGPAGGISGVNLMKWGGGCASMRVGKKVAGRLLDGKVWDQRPEGWA